MAIIYKSCFGDGKMPEYKSDACKPTEGGRVRGAAYIHVSEIAKLTSGQTNPVETLEWWKTAITNKNVVIIPSTRGTFDGGAPVIVTGFGDEKEKVTGKTFIAVINDKNHSENEAFYNALSNDYRNYVLAFRTENELRIATAPISSIDVKDPVEEDTDAPVLWQANVTWVQNAPDLVVPIYKLNDDLKSLFATGEVPA